MKKEKVIELNTNKHNYVGDSSHAIQNNKQPHVGAGALKSAQNAITLVALVITVVVLLILAGVTINLTLGNNGIFKTAQQAAKNYTEAQNKELANLNEFENIIDKVTKAPEYNLSLLQLKPGDYVKYDTGADGVGIATFRVLYDATSEYGLQIISDKNIANVTLGGNDWETGKTSYNKAIETLNNEAMKYKNSVYATDARCVGSNPSNKADEEIGPVELQFTTTVDGANNMKAKDANAIIDKKSMDILGIRITGENYWIASRTVISNLSVADFYIETEYAWEGKGGSDLCCVFSKGDSYGMLFSQGIRPCIILKPDIKVISGDGASEATAYILGI